MNHTKHTSIYRLEHQPYPEFTPFIFLRITSMNNVSEKFNKFSEQQNGQKYVFLRKRIPSKIKVDFCSWQDEFNGLSSRRTWAYTVALTKFRISTVFFLQGSWLAYSQKVNSDGNNVQSAASMPHHLPVLSSVQSIIKTHNKLAKVNPAL